MDYYGHLENEWLKAHFNMYYHTIAPGFNYTLGIGDAANFLYYGPESQLYILDSYVLMNGTANWLADTIMKHRPNYIIPVALHTDFIFYNASIPKVPPKDFDTKRHHTFLDWGVATYSSRALLNDKATYVTFKSSAIRGKHMHNLSLQYPEFINSTNPGHEHPDQNSFTLTFLGDMFITDGFYGPKLTKANNVHMFYPSKVSLSLLIL